MGRRNGVFLFILSCLVLITIPINIYAKITPHNNIQVANQSLSEWIKYNQKFDNKVHVRWDPYTGLPRQIIGHQTKPLQGNPEGYSS